MPACRKQRIGFASEGRGSPHHRPGDHGPHELDATAGQHGGANACFTVMAQRKHSAQERHPQRGAAHAGDVDQRRGVPERAAVTASTATDISGPVFRPMPIPVSASPNAASATGWPARVAARTSRPQPDDGRAARRHHAHAKHAAPGVRSAATPGRTPGRRAAALGRPSLGQVSRRPARPAAEGRSCRRCRRSCWRWRREHRRKAGYGIAPTGRRAASLAWRSAARKHGMASTERSRRAASARALSALCGPTAPRVGVPAPCLA